ncbi:MAG: nucleotidyltransferase family protein [Bacilli bacterium]|nr:nucleotidyltransferase family protein [Bacilli bacterium]
MDILIYFLKTIAKQTLTSDDINAFAQQDNDIKIRFFELIERHKLEYLFYSLIKNLEVESLFDQSIISEYFNKLNVHQSKYIEYLNSMKPIFENLEEKKIKYAVLKGFSFMDELYNTNIGLTRRFVDIDVLIDKSDLKEAKEILNNYNFVQGKIVDGSIVRPERKDLIYWELNSHQLYEYVKLSEYTSQYWIEVDINTTIFEGGKFVPPIETKILLTHSVIKKTELGISFYVLNKTFSLLQLCYHFYKDTVYETKKENHNDYCLIKFCDIREFILHFRKEIDWSEFVKIVNEFNIGDQIYYSLYLVSSFYGDLGIEEILKEIKTTPLFSIGFLDWERMLL